MDDDAERRPLIGSPNAETADIAPSPDNYPTRQSLLATFLCALIIFAYSLGSAVQFTPMAQIIEDIVCRSYTLDVSIDSALEDPCKAPDVQSELANIQAWQSTLELIPGMLVAVPYGALADKYGHKAMLTLSSIGIVLHNSSQMAICEAT